MSIKSAIGFRHVIDLLSSERKLIVGHNCFLGNIYSLHIEFHSKILSYFLFSGVFLIVFLLMLGADLAHIYSKFIGPLPSTAEEFVSAVRTYFPSIVDTKVLLNSDDVLSRIMKKGSTSLSKAFSLLCLLPVAPTGTSPRVKVDVQVDDQRFDFLCFSFTIRLTTNITTSNFKHNYTTSKITIYQVSW